MSNSDAEKWNAIYQSHHHRQQSPSQILKENDHLLPDAGCALDLACGTGTNAVFLAEYGLKTFAWDVSEQAIKQLNKRVKEFGLNIHTEVRDVVALPPEENKYDVIVVSHFLDRQLIPHIINALRKNGLLFYQTFIQDCVDDTGPHNPDYRLAQNELLQLCKNLKIVFYCEEGTIGNIEKGFRNEAMLIGQK